MTGQFAETAYAKVNLALHVRARRDDGYHDIETLFAFVDGGDELSVTVADVDSLRVSGEFADELSNGADNLVMRALALARQCGAEVPPIAISLVKNLPVAAGIGGGSADAGALLRLIMRLWAGRCTVQALTAASTTLGADVPACLASQTCFASGVGDALSYAAIGLTGQQILLVNPLLPCPTGPVFSGWDGGDRGPLDPTLWRSGRNDLTPSAVQLCPDIDDVMTVLRAQLPTLVRLSGSGATCFALFDGASAMERAANRIADDHPDWWVMAGALR